ncbi:MAG: hypothetical protein LM590_12640 [Thermofilum sp.]|nr:hypothetical protein [Thermofilum sp.]
MQYNLIYAYFAGMVMEALDDSTAMDTRIIEAFSEWLERHRNVLTY